jgi:hypothetical protein
MAQMKLAFAVLVFALLSAATVVHSKEVGRATEGNMQARLFDEQGDCPEDTQRVELFVDGVKQLDGCSIEKDGLVYMLWENGGRGRLPREAFKQTGV